MKHVFLYNILLALVFDIALFSFILNMGLGGEFSKLGKYGPLIAISIVSIIYSLILFVVGKIMNTNLLSNAIIFFFSAFLFVIPISLLIFIFAFIYCC